ncbi:hypothetical protein PPTG_22690 [Phytophthora nicotianae INRA-310]|uniref:Uncharacterized protein n=1 Tax=Phytophthora nicotianae (strain INRA-310) TaxID=761204 RepID=W2QC41_PHYN3|nr:hypothetical protein PPTG_22690 [Phytophthora nicotianae INRA-310]ETN10732.1 hypothetical protein PPTG_22690 [Phytophthora nicotianae INRA-310]
MQAVQNCATGSYKGGRLLRQFDRVRAWRTRSFNTGQLSFREMKQDDSCANYSFEHSASLIFFDVAHESVSWTFILQRGQDKAAICGESKCRTVLGDSSGNVRPTSCVCRQCGAYIHDRTRER